MKIVQRANRQLRIQDDFLDKYLGEGYKLVEVTSEAPREPPPGEESPLGEEPPKSKNPTK